MLLSLFPLSGEKISANIEERLGMKFLTMHVPEKRFQKTIAIVLPDNYEISTDRTTRGAVTIDIIVDGKITDTITIFGEFDQAEELIHVLKDNGDFTVVKKFIEECAPDGVKNAFKRLERRLNSWKP